LKDPDPKKIITDPDPVQQTTKNVQKRSKLTISLRIGNKRKL